MDFAAYLTNRCDIGSDGKAPLQRLHGRRDNTPVLEFGERILYMPAKPACANDKSEYGVRLQSKCIGTHRHARVDAEDTIGRKEQTGTWVRQAARAIEEQVKKDKQ